MTTPAVGAVLRCPPGGGLCSIYSPDAYVAVGNDDELVIQAYDVNGSAQMASFYRLYASDPVEAGELLAQAPDAVSCASTHAVRIRHRSNQGSPVYSDRWFYDPCVAPAEPNAAVAPDDAAYVAVSAPAGAVAAAVGVESVPLLAPAHGAKIRFYRPRS